MGLQEYVSEDCIFENTALASRDPYLLDVTMPDTRTNIPLHQTIWEAGFYSADGERKWVLLPGPARILLRRTIVLYHTPLALLRGDWDYNYKQKQPPLYVCLLRYLGSRYVRCWNLAGTKCVFVLFL